MHLIVRENILGLLTQKLNISILKGVDLIYCLCWKLDNALHESFLSDNTGASSLSMAFQWIALLILLYMTV